MAELITQAGLAKHFGLTRGYVSKLVKRGLLDGCRKDGKFVRECAIHAIERFRAGSRPTGRAAAKLKVVASNPQVPDSLKNTPVATPENMHELEALMAQVEDPNRRVQLMRDFWSAKLSEYKAKEHEGQLIRVDEVVQANQKIIKAFRDKALALPTKLAGVILTATTQEEARVIMDNAIYDLLEELSRELGAEADS